ncbi:hypothetical protein [Tenacibaculum amylolyticum]|uniref:hypothetical protein n=1 Tax=Tenacibaculum amylolyticum TaxID=104269 RepID=UPI0038961B4C
MKKYVISTISLNKYYFMIILSLILSFFISLIMIVLLSYFISFKFIWGIFILFSIVIFFRVINITKKFYLNEIKVSISRDIISIEKDKNIKIEAHLKDVIDYRYNKYLHKNFPSFKLRLNEGRLIKFNCKEKIDETIESLIKELDKVLNKSSY